jgi:Na+/proline symporter
MNEVNIPQNNRIGRRLGILGFILSLAALLIWLPISSVAVVSAGVFGGGMGGAVFLLILSIVGLTLSIVGLIKTNKLGDKKGLAIAGLIIGLIVSCLSVATVIKVKKTKDGFEKLGGSYLMIQECLGIGANEIIDSVDDEVKSSTIENVDSVIENK